MGILAMMKRSKIIGYQKKCLRYLTANNNTYASLSNLTSDIGCARINFKIQIYIKYVRSHLQLKANYLKKLLSSLCSKPKEAWYKRLDGKNVISCVLCN